MLLFLERDFEGTAKADLSRATGLSPDVRSIASVFLSRWDGATMDKVPGQLRDKLGIAIDQ